MGALMISKYAFVSASLCALMGCGPGVEEGPLFKMSEGAIFDTSPDNGTGSADPASVGTDSNQGFEHDSIESGTDTETLGDTTEIEVPKDGGLDSETLSAACDSLPFETDNVADIETIHPNGTFISASNRCLLSTATDMNGTLTRVTFIDPEEREFNLGMIEAILPGAPIDIVCYQDKHAPEYIAEIVVQEDSGGTPKSTVYEGRLYENVFIPLFTTERLVGISAFSKISNSIYQRICAYGDGVFCTETQGDHLVWTAERPQTGSTTYRALNIAPCGEAWCMVAVGEKGLVEIQNRAEWRQIETETNETLLTVTAFDDETYIAAGEAGALLLGSVESPIPLFTTRLSQTQDIVGLHLYEGHFYGVTDNGIVFQGVNQMNELLICPETIELDIPALTSLLVVCPIDRRFIVLSGQSLIGQYNCDALVVVV